MPQYWLLFAANVNEDMVWEEPDKVGSPLVTLLRVYIL